MPLLLSFHRHFPVLAKLLSFFCLKRCCDDDHDDDEDEEDVELEPE